MMKRETRVVYGCALRSLNDQPLPEMSWQMAGDDFLLRGEGDHYFHYRKGEGITVDRGKNIDVSEESLWLNGSVYSAVACMNGLVPIHASAVAHDDFVYAFTGPAGAGKSALVAALGDRGLPMFCDDTLLLDLSDPRRIICLPGHKRLKLCPDAIGLTGATREEKVSRTVQKFYASPASGDVGRASPLAKLIFLEEAEEMEILPISGGDRFARLQEDRQTSGLLASAQRFDREQQFAHLARLAAQIEMARFRRPMERSCFHQGVDLIVDYVVQERA